MRKNMVLTVVLALGINTMLFSSENRLSMGFEYGSFFENRTDDGIGIETYRGSPGINFSAYHLWENFGFFHSHSFLFPNKVSTNIDGYEYFFEYNLVIGPAFKIAFTEKMDMNFGFGFGLSPIVGELHNKTLTQFNLGIGGDIGFSYLFNKMFYINVGSMFSYHFANITSLGTGTYEVDRNGDREEIKDREWSRNYNMAGVRPYIRIGLSLK